MRSLAWPILTASLVLASSAACSKKSDSGTPAATVAITASKRTVVANGVNTITLTVTDTEGGPVTVTTNRGSFAGGVKTATISGASGTLTLTTCDAATESTCAGTATVTASHSTTATVSITFGLLATACDADCSADPSCASLSCSLAGGGTGTCSSTSPSTCTSAPACTRNPAGASSETSCSDGIDNDCSGDTDCDEPSCANQACQTGSPTFLCKSGACTDTTSGLAITVTPARTRLPANGTATTTVEVAVTSDGQPAVGMGVTVSTSLGTLSAGTGTTGPEGTVSFVFTASAVPGVATVSASVTAVSTVARTAAVTMPALGSLQIPATSPVQNPVQGARGSGWNEFGYVSAIVLDDAGERYPDGLAVRFEHRRLGGSTLGAPLTADTASCVAAGGCVGYLGATSSGSGAPDTVGLAKAQLYSGTLAGTLTTTASATVAGVTRAVTLPTVAVVGARANGANLSVVCDPRNVPALAETDCAISLVDAPFTCQAMLKDRYNNLLGTTTQVVFMSEAAAVGQVTTTPEYDPTNPSADLGIATQIFNTLGSGLPFDVAANGGEPSVSHALDGCGTRTHNPRDGVVTVLAVADGEEAFFDSNGNGAYDAGEPFVDQGEPFVDQDDDGQWDVGEWFLDVDGSAGYTVGNLAWDGATKIWTQTVVVYSGLPATPVAAGPTYLGTRWADAFTDACTATPAPAPFSVLAEQPGPPIVAATSDTYFVAASDMNLNMLATATSYAVTVGAGTVTADYLGLASYADQLGAFYRYWPCDQTGACASQCRSTGAALPCVMTPAITSYSCGVSAPVVITGGATPDPGTVRIDWEVTTPYSVFGANRSYFVERILTGQSL